MSGPPHRAPPRRARLLPASGVSSRRVYVLRLILPTISSAGLVQMNASLRWFQPVMKAWTLIIKSRTDVKLPRGGLTEPGQPYGGADRGRVTEQLVVRLMVPLASAVALPRLAPPAAEANGTSYLPVSSAAVHFSHTARPLWGRVYRFYHP